MRTRVDANDDNAYGVEMVFSSEEIIPGQEYVAWDGIWFMVVGLCSVRMNRGMRWQACLLGNE